MAGDEMKHLQERLRIIEARTKALADADENASWGKAAAARGGSRQEQLELTKEAARIKARLGEGSTKD